MKALEVPKDWRGSYVVAFSPGASMIAVGGYKKFGLFSTHNGKLLTEVRHPRSSFFRETETSSELPDIEFWPNGRLLLTGSNNGTICLWRVAE